MTLSSGRLSTLWSTLWLNKYGECSQILDCFSGSPRPGFINPLIYLNDSLCGGSCGRALKLGREGSNLENGSLKPTRSFARLDR